MAGQMQKLGDQDEIVVQSGKEYLVSLNLESSFTSSREPTTRRGFRSGGTGKAR